MNKSKPYRAAALLAVLNSQALANTLTVTDLGDAGSGLCANTCTLRDAIDSAVPNDSIVFASTLTYPATITLNGQELLLYKNLTIVGPGAGLLVIDGNQLSRILEVAANATVTVSGLALNNGTVAGSDGGFNVSQRARDGGDAYGGGVLVNAGSSLQLVACCLSGNHAAGGNGGTSGQIYSTQGSGGSGHGGAIYSAGTLSITAASFSGNYVYGGVPGGFLSSSNVVEGNGGNAVGGAIEATGMTEISNSQFLGNSAQAPSGGSGFGGVAGGNGGAALGGAMAFSGFSELSFVTALGSNLVGGYAGQGNPSGAAGEVAGADVYTTATLLSRSNVLTSTSGAPTARSQRS